MLVQLGKTLGMTTLGEGIEDEAQLDRLQREQCDLGQGFLFARPLTVAGIDRMLDETRDEAVDARDGGAVTGHC
jgi:EAL domain-containing protein (putative c-di-GMP-specific phosphodiesterase class I)